MGHPADSPKASGLGTVHDSAQKTSEQTKDARTEDQGKGSLREACQSPTKNLRHSNRTSESMQSGGIGAVDGDALANTYLNLAMPKRIKSPATPARHSASPSFAQSAMQLVSPPPPPPMPLRLSGKSPDT